MHFLCKKCYAENDGEPGSGSKPKRGGSRPNAGRKPTGKTAITRSVSMPPEAWAGLDYCRFNAGKSSRGKFIALLLRKGVEDGKPDLGR